MYEKYCKQSVLMRSTTDVQPKSGKRARCAYKGPACNVAGKNSSRNEDHLGQSVTYVERMEAFARSTLKF